MKLCIMLLAVACATGCMSVKPFNRELDEPKLLHIEDGRITMASRVVGRGSPSLAVWSYTSKKPLWLIEPKEKKIKGKAPLSFSYTEVPTGYAQKHPSGLGTPALPAKGDVVIFNLSFTHETILAPIGSSFSVAYTYYGINQWRKAPVPEDAYTPEGWDNLLKPNQSIQATPQ